MIPLITGAATEVIVLIVLRERASLWSPEDEEVSRRAYWGVEMGAAKAGAAAATVARATRVEERILRDYKDGV